jgi:hypothetical protein
VTKANHPEGSVTRPAKPRRGEFRIACRDNEPVYHTGYIRGDWAIAKSQHFWDVTHLPTGLKLTTYPVIERKAEAIAHLERVAANPADVYPDFVLEGLAKAPRL